MLKLTRYQERQLPSALIDEYNKLRYLYVTLSNNTKKQFDEETTFAQFYELRIKFNTNLADFQEVDEIRRRQFIELRRAEASDRAREISIAQYNAKMKALYHL